MTQAFVSIGSNIDPALNVARAVAAMNGRFGQVRVSAVYESPAVGFAGDNFYNLVAGFETTDSLPDLMASLRSIEDAQGRDRSEPRFAARTLDLDLILYGDRIEHSDTVVIPRPEIAGHAFVLAPLADIAPDGVHPETGERFGDMWLAFAGDRELKRVNVVLPISVSAAE